MIRGGKIIDKVVRVMLSTQLLVKILFLESICYIPQRQKG